MEGVVSVFRLTEKSVWSRFSLAMSGPVLQAQEEGGQGRLLCICGYGTRPRCGSGFRLSKWMASTMTAIDRGRVKALPSMSGSKCRAIGALYGKYGSESNFRRHGQSRVFYLCDEHPLLVDRR